MGHVRGLRRAHDRSQDVPERRRLSAREIDVEAHGLVAARKDVNPVRTRLEHGTAILESKVFRNADVIAVRE